jgi:hypothetical protein
MPKLIPNKGIYTRTKSASHCPSSDVYYVPGCRPESYARILARVKVWREEARQTIPLWRLWVLVWNSFYFLRCKKFRSGCRQIAATDRNRTRAACDLDVRLCPQPDHVVRLARGAKADNQHPFPGERGGIAITARMQDRAAERLIPRHVGACWRKRDIQLSKTVSQRGAIV